MTGARTQRLKKTLKSKSAKAGLIFPVARMLRHLKQTYLRKMFRCSVGAGVYVAAVIEYMIADFIEIAGNHAKLAKKKRVHPRDIMMAIASDQEMHEVLRDVIIPGAGVVPHINLALIRSQKPSKAAKSPSTKQKTGARKPATPKVSAKRSKAGIPIPIKADPPKAPALVSSKSSTSKPAAPPRKVSVKAGDIVILGEKTLHLGQKLTVIRSDITKVPVDAVVHPTNSTLYTGGFIGQAIAQRGGAEYLNEVNKAKTSGNLGADSAMMTPAFNINARFVIHCNGPMWNDANNVTRLSTAVRNILTLADEKDLRSIAIPSIGSGKAGWPKQTAAETILRAIHGYFASSAQSSILQIYFVLFDQESIDVYIGELDKLVA